MTNVLCSSANPLIKKIAALKKRKYRDETGLFLVEGIRAAEEVIAADWTVETCVYSHQLLSNPRGEQLLRLVQQRYPSAGTSSCRIIQVEEPLFAKLADTETPQGVLLAVQKQSAPLETLFDGNAVPLLVVIDGVQDPGNAGTIVRAADAAGCTGIVVLKGCVDLFGAKAVRASMGSLLHIPVSEGVDPETLTALLKQHRVMLLAAAPEAAVEHYAADYRQPLALLLGNEGNGISPGMLAASNQRIRIPLLGKAESLNVAMAAAVILYEAVRQRRSAC
ncbi:MAG TPA: RNA methyltransferase [Patescibacteria group bacterium]|nr:RNA methyltransferase [Patescibacteria group bacterium]